MSQNFEAQKLSDEYLEYLTVNKLDQKEHPFSKWMVNEKIVPMVLRDAAANAILNHVCVTPAEYEELTKNLK